MRRCKEMKSKRNNKLLFAAMGILTAMLVMCSVPVTDAAGETATEDTKTFFDDLTEKWNTFITDHGLGTVLMLILGVIAMIAWFFVRDQFLLYAGVVLLAVPLILIVGNIDGLIAVEETVAPKV